MRRLLVRWLTHRSRVPRGPRIALALVLGAVALVSLAAQATGETGYPSNGPGGPPYVKNPVSKAPEPPGPGNPVKTFPTSARLVATGHALYNQHCSSCHGEALQGIPGTAPSLHGVGAGPLDFYLSTGRMPLQNPSDEPMRSTPLFTRAQIDAVIAYVTKYGGGPPAPTADPSKGNLARGLHEFTLNCAGCHQMVARGGMFVGAWVPNLLQATPQQIAEAVRMGPYMMPHFDSKQISQYDLDSIARYVVWTHHPSNNGGWSIYNIGPIPEGMVGWFLGLGALLIVARLIGERTDERTGSTTPTNKGG